MGGDFGGEERRKTGKLCPYLLDICAAFGNAADLLPCFLKFFLPEASMAFKELVHQLVRS